ncbi:MAG TPA: response regulator transcription factor [Solirubrobacteraceae bacterium]|nr:response regulator transcription factor [Solirubrobacteraceae bacterium]
MIERSILIVEDDRELSRLLARALTEEGFSARTCATAREAMQESSRQPPDAMVLDVGLPDADGRDLCQALRAQGALYPVLFLTARDAVSDRLAGFRAGGDDYVTKPFAVAEVAARLEALLRRRHPEAVLELGALHLDPTGHRVTVDGGAITLTPTEFRLLAALAARVGQAVRRRDLIRAGWPEGAIVHDNTLDVYLARLRRKLPPGPTVPAITTVHGLGYRLEPPQA